METEPVPQHPPVIKDDKAIKEVISKVKSQGLFDQFRKECIADVDTKPAYHNLLQRVESYVEHFLKEQKWSSIKNKNQLRETLRRQLNNSGMMHNGVERIIEQVVNPKILLGIKPKVDEAVCDHLGIDLKARQEEQQRKKQEQQRLLLQQQQQLQQQNLQAKINQNIKPDESFELAKKAPPISNMGPWGPGMANFPTPSVPGVGNPITGMPGNPQCIGNFPGMMQPFSMMGGWAPGFNPAMQPMVPGQPMIPAFPGAGLPPGAPGINPFNTNISPAPGSVPTSKPPVPTSVIPDLSKPPPGLPNAPLPSTATSRSPIVVPPRSSSITPAPPGSVPPPPGTVPVVPPASSSLVPPGTTNTSLPARVPPTTPTIPALISHTLAKVSEDKLTPEKIAVFKTAAAFITKTVNNAQGTPTDLATMFSPRVLAEAMMEESGKPMSKHEMRAARRKERMKEIERLKAEKDSEKAEEKIEKEEDKEDPLPPKHNLMDVFQGAEDVSDDEEALDLLMDVDEMEDKNKTGIILSDESDKEGLEQPPTSQRGKRYNFAWDVDINPEELSDVTISSIHTSDISSFEEDASSSESDNQIEQEMPSVEKEESVSIADNTNRAEDDAEIHNDDVIDSENPENSQEKTEEVKTIPLTSNEEGEMIVEKNNNPSLSLVSKSEPALPDLQDAPKFPRQRTQSLQPQKPRKLLALSSNFSDSDDDETREERKARIAKEKEERYLKRQQRRAELEAKRKEREEEKARLREEKKRQNELVSETKSEDSSVLVSSGALEGVVSEDQNVATTASEQESTSKSTPRKRKNKAELKEQLLQQKVMERKAALRRRRTRNRRYASDEFTTIFSERKTLNQGYNEDVINSEELVTFDGSLEVVELTVDQECVVETVSEVIETSEDPGQGNQPRELVLQCPSPYSDISDRSMSDKFDLSKPDNVSVDKVSSDDDLEDEFEDFKAEEEMPAGAKVDQGLAPQAAVESDDGCLLQDVGNSHTTSEPVSPRSRISTHSKSVISQDDFENTSSSIPDEKSSQKSTGASHAEEDKESQISLNEVLEFMPGVKSEKLKSQNTDAKASSPKDIMADLELEPVSDEDSSLGAISDGEKDLEKEKEEGEDKDSDGEMASPSLPKVDQDKQKLSIQKDDGIPEDENASDEGEIKSDSEEEEMASKPQPQDGKKEEESPRLASKKPIEFVDFGEAEKRARGSRVFYSESERRRSSNVQTPGYRSVYTWQAPGTQSGSIYTPNQGRYSTDASSPLRSKSPGAAFEAESETSSRSRSSGRVRDDVPPPYPIEGISRKHKSSAPSTPGSSGIYKPVSPPSPVSSSSSSSRSGHSRSRSRSRSRSPLSSRSVSSDSYSSGSRTSSRKRRSSRKKQKRRHRSGKSRSRSRDLTLTPSIRSHSPSSRMSFADRPSPPHRNVEAPGLLDSSGNVQKMQGHLSSGNESISSDELPYFDEEAEKLSKPSKIRRQRLSRESSSSNKSSSSPSRAPDSPGKASISSSELIYSPTRQQVRDEYENSDASSSTNRKRRTRKRRRTSSSRYSASSNGEVMSPRIESGLVYSPHRPSSPTNYPLVPDDMSGFQPPLPQDSPDRPPLPCSPEQPPLPPLPPDDLSPQWEDSALPPPPPSPPPLPSSPEEVEEGECPSSPEFEEHIPASHPSMADDVAGPTSFTAGQYSRTGKASSNSPASTKDGEIHVSKISAHTPSPSQLDSEKATLCSSQPNTSMVTEPENSDINTASVPSPCSDKEVKEETLSKSPGRASPAIITSEVDGPSLADSVEKNSQCTEIKESEIRVEGGMDISSAGGENCDPPFIDCQKTEPEEPQLPKGLKRPAEACEDTSAESPPAKRCKEEDKEEK